MRQCVDRWARGLTGLVMCLTVVLLGCSAPDSPDPAAERQTEVATPGTDQSTSPTATERSPDPDEATVDAALRETLSDAVGGNIYPGMLILVRSDDSTRVLTDGVANQQTGEPLTARHRFPAPAVTQPVVAAVVLQLAEEASSGSTTGWKPTCPVSSTTGPRSRSNNC